MKIKIKTKDFDKVERGDFLFFSELEHARSIVLGLVADKKETIMHDHKYLKVEILLKSRHYNNTSEIRKIYKHKYPKLKVLEFN